MASDTHYFSPTTPGAASFDIDVSDVVRRGRIGPLPGNAVLGSPGTGTQELDDIDSTLGHDDDGILGLKQWYHNEDTAPVGNQRVFTGYTFDRNYRRGDSLVQGAARQVEVTLADVNAFLSFRVFAPVADDPTSSFVRPAEDAIDRIQALLNDVDFLSTTLFDLGYIPTTGGKPMDANDYTGSKPQDVLNDIAQVMGWNYWVGYDETANELFLWMDDPNTDGADTVPYDSTLKLTNVQAEHDADPDVLLIEMGAVENVDPTRVISAVWVMGKGGVNVYRTRPETAWTYGWRDAVMQADFLSDPAKLADLGDRYLLDNSTEDHKITLSVQIPSESVTLIHEGMRIQLHATHLPSVAADFTWCRILQCTRRREVDVLEYYWLDLELSPAIAPVEFCLAAQNTVIENSNRDASASMDTGVELRGTTWAYVATNPFHSDNAITNPLPSGDPIDSLFTWRLAVLQTSTVGDPALVDIMVNLSPLPLSQGTSPPFTPVPTQTGTFTVPSTLSTTNPFTYIGWISGADYGAGTVTVDEGWEVCLTRLA